MKDTRQPPVVVAVFFAGVDDAICCLFCCAVPSSVSISVAVGVAATVNYLFTVGICFSAAVVDVEVVAVIPDP